MRARPPPGDRWNLVWLAFLGCGFVALVTFIALPDSWIRAAIATGIALSAAGAILIGVQRFQPAAPSAWRLIGLGIAAMALGDGYAWISVLLSFPIIRELLSDTMYLVGYAAVITGLFRVVRSRTRGRDRGTRLDALLLSLGMTPLVATLLILPALEEQVQSPASAVVASMLPLLDILLVGALARLALVPGQRIPALWLLTAGVTLTLISDLTYAATTAGSSQTAEFVYVLWLAGYLLLGASGLHPSMVRVSEPLVGDEPPGVSRFVLLPATVAGALVLVLVIGVSPLALAGVLFLSVLVTGRIAVLGYRADHDWLAERATEDALRRAAIAEEANQQKNEFLSRTSHELRTPLNAVLGFGQLLEMEDLDEGQRESVDHIMAAGRHLLSLIDDILDTARIESGKIELSRQAVSLREVIREAIELVEPMAAERGVSLICEDGLEFELVTDRTRLSQILLNLLSNGVKFNHIGGSVHVRWNRSRDGATVQVIDTGQGIEAPDLERIFEPFNRLGVAASAVPGTGLGLTVTKGLVETLGGSLHVASTIGVGSTFQVTLPLDPSILPDGAPDLSGIPAAEDTQATS